MKRVLLPLAAIAALGLAACSEQAKNETADPANAIAADANATMSEAAQDVEAATDSALGAAENAADGGESRKNGPAIRSEKLNILRWPLGLGRAIWIRSNVCSHISRFSF